MEFSEIFSQLRRERNISQRKAANDLNISQALLSHYENGLREPRFEFVIRACEYYNVSADYLFGRTSVKENPMITGAGISKAGDENALSKLWESGNMYSLINAVAVIMNMMINVFGDTAADRAYDYFSITVYSLFRHMGILNAAELEEKIKVPEYKFSVLCDSAVKELEGDILDITNDIDHDKICREYIENFKKEFPSAYGMFADWLMKADGEICKKFRQRCENNDSAG